MNIKGVKISAFRNQSSCIFQMESQRRKVTCAKSHSNGNREAEIPTWIFLFLGLTFSGCFMFAVCCSSCTNCCPDLSRRAQLLPSSSSSSSLPPLFDLLLLLIFLSIYLLEKQNDTQRGKNTDGLFSKCAGLGQEPGTPSRLPSWMTGSKYVGLLLWLSKAH